MANISPIFSKQGDIQGGDILTTAAADFTGQGVNNAVIFSSDLTNGGFIQRLRFKAVGANAAATCARIYINNGGSREASVAGAPTFGTNTPSTTGGTLQSGSYYAKVVSVDQYGGFSAASTESTVVTVTGPTGSIQWNWGAVTGAVSYRIYVGPVSNGQLSYFTTNTNTFTQTTAIGTRENVGNVSNNNYFYGEISLPTTTTTITTASASVEIDYPMNVALPPGYRVLVGLTVTAVGWQVTGIGGSY